jgi:hypothetical protein
MREIIINISLFNRNIVYHWKNNLYMCLPFQLRVFFPQSWQISFDATKKKSSQIRRHLFRLAEGMKVKKMPQWWMRIWNPTFSLALGIVVRHHFFYILSRRCICIVQQASSARVLVYSTNQGCLAADMTGPSPRRGTTVQEVTSTRSRFAPIHAYWWAVL